MKKAIVTGASSGIGEAIAKRLAAEGFEVYGIGRSFKNSNEKTDEKDKGIIHQLVLDLLDFEKTEKVIKEIDRDGDVYILVNNAGVGFYGLHEQLRAADIMTMLRTNLELPMLLSNLLLKTIKKNKGYIVNISSHTATQANPHGCAYGATKAGLSSFSKSLFEEERKYGLKVINIEPDMTDTALYRNANFGVDDDIQAYLLPDEVADAVIYALGSREGCAITDIHLQPQINRIKRSK